MVANQGIRDDGAPSIVTSYGLADALAQHAAATRDILQYPSADPATSHRTGQPHADLQPLGCNSLQTHDPRGHDGNQDHQADLPDRPA